MTTCCGDNFFRAWIGGGGLAASGMVRVEIERGMRAPWLRQRLAGFFDVMIFGLEGVTLSARDVVIAPVAPALGAAVPTDDAHFDHVPGMRVLKPAVELPCWQVGARPVSRSGMVYLLPALSAVVYALGAHVFKRAMDVGPWRVTFLCNMAMALCYAPLLALHGGNAPGGAWYEPLVTGALFFLGQVFTFRAIQAGDVSVATPVLGTKVLFVTGLAAVLTAQPIAPATWFAALLTALAIALLGIGGRGARHGKVGTTILLASTSALFFAATDVLVQKWAPGWGAFRFIPAMFFINGLLSFALIPMFSAPLRAIPRGTWRLLIPGCILIALQALGMAVTLAVFGRAPEANIIYSSRGLWSVVLVLVAARHLDQGERALDLVTLLARLAASLLLIAAIALVVGG